MIRVGILGGTGYAGAEAIRWLLRHPEVQITAVTSRRTPGSMVSDLLPQFVRQIRIPIEDCTAEQLAERCDVVLSCLPNGASVHRVMDLLDAGCRVIDLSPDYRLSCPSEYEKWYGEKHPDPARLGSTPYGLPELFHDSVREAPLVATPGCSGAASVLPLAPLIKEKLVEAEDVIIDCKSGISSEGKMANRDGLYCDVNESVGVHSMGSSRHQPEIIDAIQRYSGTKLEMSFTPHAVPMERGVMATMYLTPTGTVTPNQIRECLISYYHNSPFVRVISHLPATRFVTNTNFVDIAVRENGPRVTVICTLDNLVKGGCGTAIQNMNRMFGLPETMGVG